MATPQVAGVVALMWSANPALVGDMARTRQILRDTAHTGRAGRRQLRPGGGHHRGRAGRRYAAVRAARR